MLKHAPTDRKLMILMNEFGDEGVDGALIEDPELELMEISRGSIFCGCVKGDYIKGLYRIAFVIKPEILVIEATGVANPADLRKDLDNPAFKGSFALKEKFCLIDAANMLEQYEIFTAVEKQIESTDAFIINKVDLSDPGIIKRIRELILSHNPHARFVETTYANVDFGGLFQPVQRVELTARRDIGEPERLLTDAEIEEIVDRALEDQAAQLEPPDRLVSMTCRWPDGKLEDFRYVAANLPADVVRAKGFIFEQGRPYFYSHVGRSHEIVPFDGRELRNTSINRVVFIRREFKTDDIRSMFEERGLEVTVSGSAGTGGAPLIC
jgi:G3E family GTPase